LKNSLCIAIYEPSYAIMEALTILWSHRGEPRNSVHMFLRNHAVNKVVLALFVSGKDYYTTENITQNVL